MTARFFAAGALGALLVSSAGCSSKMPVQPLAADSSAEIGAASGVISFFEPPQRRSPSRTSWETFFPLDSGSVWTYDRRFTIWGDEQPAQATQQQIVSRMLGKQWFGDIAYSVQEDRWTSGGSSYPPQYLYLRQDRQGLYEIDAVPFPRRSSLIAMRALSAADRAPTAARREAWLRAGAALDARWAALEQALGGGHGLAASPSEPGIAAVLPGELRRLAYPLRIGRTWVLRREPLFTMTVEGIDRITVEDRSLLGYRIRIDSELFGPQDRVVVWYGSDGFLGLDALAVGEVTDEAGNTIGRLYASEVRRLISLHVVRTSPPAFTFGPPE